jgi:hypothetical protein
MNNSHEPDPQFIENLEWRLESEERRLHRLRTLSGRTQGWKVVKTIGVIVFSVFLGFFVSTTAAYIRDTSQRDLLLTKQEIRIYQHESYNQLLKARLKDSTMRVADGILPPIAKEEIALQIWHNDIALQSLKLDYEEIEASSRPPQNDLSSPLVGGRDFVTERLQLRRLEYEEAYRSLEGKMLSRQRDTDSGATNPTGIEDIRLHMYDHEMKMKELDEKLHLRNRFIEGELSAKQVDLLVMISEAETKLDELQTYAAHHRDRLKAIEREFQLGRVSNTDVLMAQFQLEAAETEEQVVQIELQLLRNNLENNPD